MSIELIAALAILGISLLMWAVEFGYHIGTHDWIDPKYPAIIFAIGCVLLAVHLSR